jgi:cytochrome c-type biogenesis protein CcmE
MKYVSPDNLYKSYKAYEAYVHRQVKSGQLDNQTARSLLAKAKTNYRNQNLNREMDKIHASGNTKKPTIHI